MSATEPHLNENYHVEITEGDNLVSRVEITAFPTPYVARFPFPKDNAIRLFHLARREITGTQTIELWRSTPTLVCCVRATVSKVEVMP